MAKFKLVFYSIAFILIFNSCKKNATPALLNDLVIKKKIDQFTEVQYGNMPLIISVPHGGLENPSTTPDRSCPNITTVTDSKTIEIALTIDSVCKADYGFQPYLVINHLNRIKLDQNREITEATCGNNNLNTIWNNYHFSIDTCITKITKKYPQALFIDLHGHGHTKQRLELGYLVDANELRNPATILASSTSYYNMLLPSSISTGTQFLTTANAFGTLMANKNFPSVPSAQDAAPAIGDLFFNGGFNTQKYTSTLYPKVFGWQIECNFSGVRDNQTNRIKFAKAFLQSLMEFYSKNTIMQPSTFGK